MKSDVIPRNHDANCGNCPLSANTPGPLFSNGDPGLACRHTDGFWKGPHGASGRVVADDVCSEHPDFWGWTKATCGQCAWICVEEAPSTNIYGVCRRSASSNLCSLLPATPACPAYMPRPEPVEEK